MSPSPDEEGTLTEEEETMLDFTQLSDDQIVELVRAACEEAVHRNPAVADATRNAMLSEAEKIAIAKHASEAEAARLREKEAQRVAEEAARNVREKAQREALNQRSDAERARWARRGAFAEKLIHMLGDGWTITVWNRGDKRIYLDHMRNFGSRKDPRHAKVSFYVTGNRYNKPGSLQTENLDCLVACQNVDDDQLRALCTELAGAYSEVRFSADEAAA